LFFKIQMPIELVGVVNRFQFNLDSQKWQIIPKMN
jgi:hypothetical protein